MMSLVNVENFSVNSYSELSNVYVNYVFDKQNLVSRNMNFTIGEQLHARPRSVNDYWYVEVNKIDGLKITCTCTSTGYSPFHPVLGYKTVFTFSHDDGDWISSSDNRSSLLIINHLFHASYAYAVSNLYVGYTISCIVVGGIKKGKKEIFSFVAHIHASFMGNLKFVSTENKDVFVYLDVNASNVSVRSNEYEWDIREWMNMKKNGIYFMLSWLKRNNKLGSFSKDFMKIVKSFL